MKKSQRQMRVLLAASLLVVASFLQAFSSRHEQTIAEFGAVLFQDNFDAENGGAGEINFFTLTHWNVTAGSIDLIGNGFADFLPGNGLYLDLDGTTFQAATIETKTTFTLLPGNYRLQFRLAGSQRGDPNRVDVSLGDVYFETFTPPTTAPFETVTRDLIVSTTTSGKLVFQSFGTDNMGFLLDDVQLLTDISEPRLFHITPNHGGNAGNVTITLGGINFPTGSVAVRLTGQGHEILAGSATVISPTQILATFNLTGATPGVREVVLTLSDGSTLTLPDGFTVEEGGEPELWVEILGRTLVRPGQQQTFQILVGNSGNIDMDGFAVLQLSVPDGVNQVTARYNGLDVGTFTPGIALDPAQSLFTAQTSQPVLVPWTVGEIASGGHAVITASMTPSQSGFLGAEVVMVPRGLMADTVHSIFKAKAIEMGIDFPNLSDAFVNAYKAAIARTLGEGLKELSKPGEAKITFNQTDFATTNALAATAEISDRFPREAEALNAALIRMRTSTFSFLLFSNYRRLVPAPQSVLPVEKLIQVVNSHDPNEKIGPLGNGEPRYFAGGEPLRYAIYFENLESATAPAQEIVITDQLTPGDLQLNSFRFDSIAFGDELLVLQHEDTNFTREVDLRPTMNLIVKITAQLNTNTGLLTWRFSSIDPETGLPPEDPLAGFLPPGAEGNVVFTVSPKSNLPTGTVINNAASIVFDNNAAIETPTWSNTLDNSAPSSQVHTLTPATCSASIDVQWSGTDIGSGVLDYTVYVSDNGGPFNAWLSNTTATSRAFPGQFGHTYSFYSVARDRTGNTESAPHNPDASHFIVNPAPFFAISVTPSIVKRGDKVVLNAAFKSCASTVVLKLSLTTPRTNSLVLTLPVVLPAEQEGSLSIPLTIPKSTPLGLYTLTLDVYVDSIKTSTATTQLTVTK